ncbi:MAG: hypothetical protein AB7F43_05080 [Bacteriovoracia bacterium]
MRRFFFHFFNVLSLIAIAISYGCAKSGKKNASGVLRDCVLPDEQKNSLQGKWSSPPIKVSFKAGEFNSSEITAIQAAVKTWNSFFQASKGVQVIDAGPDGAGYQSVTSQVTPQCSSSTLSDGVVLYKRASNWTHAKNAVALTTICTQLRSQGLPEIFNAIMEFNYVNFFTQSSGRFPDIESIALHELGHMFGLDHSCGPLKNNLSNVACPDQSADPNNALFKTVMFPDVFFSDGYGEVKRSLDTNDQGRANCLYGDQG